MTIAELQEKDRQGESKVVARQLVDIEILYLLRFGDKSGYELKKELLNSFSINVSYGTLYPHLHSLEKSHLIAGVWMQKDSSVALKKRVYNLTPTGAQVLRGSVRTLAETAITMQFMLSDVNLLGADSFPSEEVRSILELSYKFFSDSGYDVSMVAKARGSSGVEHVVELLATKAEPKREKVLLKIATSENITIGDILKLRALATDINATRAVLLTVTKPTEEVMRLASFYSITVCEGSDWPSAASNLGSHFK